MARRKNIQNSLKLQIIKAYLQGKIPVSELSEKYQIQPSQIYTWTNQLFENGERVFERKNCRNTGEGAAKRFQDRIVELESKLNTKNNVISELTEELVLEKKLGGGLLGKSGSLHQHGTN